MIRVCLESTGTLSFSRVVEGEIYFFPEYDQVLMAPVVGPLYDSNEDGLISEDDIPSVAVIMDDGGLEGFQIIWPLRIFSGLDGEEQIYLRQGTYDDLMVLPYAYSGIALGDIDEIKIRILSFWPKWKEGFHLNLEIPQILKNQKYGPLKPISNNSHKKNIYPVAAEVDGTIKWISAFEIGCGGHHPALADLNGDGLVEVIVAGSILHGKWWYLSEEGGARLFCCI